MPCRMSDVDEFAITLRLVRAFREPDGTLGTQTTRDDGVRGAVLLDLAMLGRLTSEDDGIDVDTSPTGFAPADRFLSGLERHPDRSMAWWLRRGTLGRHDIAVELIREGEWSMRSGLFSRRYDTADPESPDRDLLRTASAGSLDPFTAVVLALAVHSGLPGRIDTSALVELAGPARWLLPDVLSHLDAVRSLRGVRSTGGDAYLGM